MGKLRKTMAGASRNVRAVREQTQMANGIATRIAGALEPKRSAIIDIVHPAATDAAATAHTKAAGRTRRYAGAGHSRTNPTLIPG